MPVNICKKVENFFQHYPLSQLKKGEVITRPGELMKWIYYLKKGLVKQYLRSNSGEKFIVHIFRPGSFFLMTWILDNPVNRSYFEALGKVEIQKAPISEVRSFIREEPEVLYGFTLRLLKGVSGLVNRLEALVFEKAYVKVAALLTYLAKTYGESEQGEIIVDLPLTHREIATWTGITRETASLQVEELKRKGIISYRGRQMVVNNLEELEKEISSYVIARSPD